MPRSKHPSSSGARSYQWLTFGPTVCSELEPSLEKEWWMASGLGGYSAGTVLNALTRSRHGLLVAATKPPDGLVSLVAKFEETLYVLDQPYPLSTNCFEETFFPKGYAHLKRFSLNPFPTFTYEIEDFRLEKTIYLKRGENTVAVHYQLVSGEEELVRLEIRPLLTCRPIDSLRTQPKGLDGEITTSKGQVCFKAGGGIPPIYFAHQAAIVDKEGEWLGPVTYPRDQEEGESSREHLYSPCNFIYSFMARDEVMLAVSTKPVALPNTPSEWLNVEKERITKIRRRFVESAEGVAPKASSEAQQLALQSEHFLVGRGEKPNDVSILRGYFGETDSAWASMIALPGLLLVPGRYEEAKSVLLHYIELLDRGFLPSGFRAQDGAPVYRSIDAALWFFEAVFLYAEAAEDFVTVERKMYPALRRIIKYYEQGTHFGVHVDATGLIQQDDGKAALTWMNAAVRDVPVTPRAGKAVEVNALWYNALRVTEFFAIKFRDTPTAKAMDRAALKCYEHFNSLFWSESKNLVYDCIQGERKDASVRPNQLIAMSLTFPVLKKKCWGEVIQTVTQELFTPFGMRTLSKRSKSYRMKYTGDRMKRAQAEHQGTVWAWLMGPYVRAYLAHHGTAKPVREKLLRLFDPLLNQLSHYGLNAISSAYDAASPHTARGLVGDACAAGEVLRSLYDLTAEGPKKETMTKFELT